MSTPTTSEVEAGRAEDASTPGFEDAPVGLVLADPLGRVVAANQMWRRITGFPGVLPIEEHEAWALIHPDDRSAVQLAWEVARAGHQSLEVRARVVTRDGDVRWVDTRATPVLDRAGHLRGFAGSLLDLSHVLDQQGRLPANDGLPAAAADALPQGVMIYEPDGGIAACNTAAHELLGVSREDLLALRVPWATWDPVDGDGSPLEPAGLPAGRALLGEPVAQGVVGFTPPGRSRVWVDATARRLDDESAALPAGTVVTSFTDITVRKRIEDDLRDSEAHLRSLSESVPVGVFRCNLDGRLTYVNPRWTEMTGIAGTDIFRLHAFELIHPDDREATLAEWEETLPQGLRYDGQFRIVGADGEPRWVQCRLSVVRDKFGTPTGTIGSFEDVSALVAAREQNARLATIVESTSPGAPRPRRRRPRRSRTARPPRRGVRRDVRRGRPPRAAPRRHVER